MFQKIVINIEKHMVGGNIWGKKRFEQVLKQNNSLKINELLDKFGCLTWIRTKTNCTKNSCATVTPSGNPIPLREWTAKIGVGVKFSKYLCVLVPLLSI